MTFYSLCESDGRSDAIPFVFHLFIMYNVFWYLIYLCEDFHVSVVTCTHMLHTTFFLSCNFFLLYMYFLYNNNYYSFIPSHSLAMLLQFDRVCTILGRVKQERETVMDDLQKCAVLVQGCWVVHSSLVMDKEQRNARDYMVSTVIHMYSTCILNSEHLRDI